MLCFGPDWKPFSKLRRTHFTTFKTLKLELASGASSYSLMPFHMRQICVMRCECCIAHLLDTFTIVHFMIWGHVCEEEKPIHIIFDGFSFHRYNIDLLQKDIINYSFGNFAVYDRFNQISYIRDTFINTTLLRCFTLLSLSIDW